MASTLAADITAAATEVAVTSDLTNNDFTGAAYFTVDAENVRVSGGFGTSTWVIERGVGGTTAATHSSGATMTRYYPDAASGGGGDVTVGDGAITDPTVLMSTSGLLIGDLQVGAGNVHARLRSGDPSVERASLLITDDETTIVHRSAANVVQAELKVAAVNSELTNGNAGLTLVGGDRVQLGIGGNEIYIDSTTVAFFGGNGAAQSAAITDATDAATTMARLNTLLAYLRSLGLIAT